MASTYSANNGMEKPAKGDLDGTWGDMVNENMDIIDRALSGVGTITLSGTTHTLTTTDGGVTDGQFKVLVLSGSPSGTNTITISPSDQQKLYFVVNSSGQSATFTQGTGSNVTVPNGGSDIIYADGGGDDAVVTSVLSKTLTTGNIIIPNAGNIGSASDTDALAISSAGVVSLSATTEASATNTAALTVAGGLGVAKDVWIGDDLVLDSDSAVLKFGDDQDTTLTHTDGTGLTLNSTNKLTFGDAASFVQQSGDGVLRIDGEATIDMNASTAVTVSNDLKLDSDAAVLGFGADNDVTLTHVADTGLLLSSTDQLQFGDSGTYIHQSADGVLDLVSDTEIELTATSIDINGTIVGVQTFSSRPLLEAGFQVYPGDSTKIDSFYSAGSIFMGRNADADYFEGSGQGIFLYDNRSDTYTSVLAQDTSGGDPVFHHRIENVTKSEIEANGDFLSATNSYGAVSDQRLKENIVDSGSQWADIKAVRVRKYSFKEEELEAPNQLGVIAQELEASGMAGLVKTKPSTTFSDSGDGSEVPVLDKEGNPTSYKTVKYSALYMKSVKALQEAMERIESLEARCAALENK